MFGRGEPKTESPRVKEEYDSQPNGMCQCCCGGCGCQSRVFDSAQRGHSSERQVYQHSDKYRSGIIVILMTHTLGSSLQDEALAPVHANGTALKMTRENGACTLSLPVQRNDVVGR